MNVASNQIKPDQSRAPMPMKTNISAKNTTSGQLPYRLDANAQKPTPARKPINSAAQVGSLFIPSNSRIVTPA
jgi:hypothetical protein